MKRVLVGSIVLMGLVHTSMGRSLNHLRARPGRQQQQQQNASNAVDHYDDGRHNSNAGGGRNDSSGYASGRYGRSLKSIRDPQCTMPEEAPCTLTTSAIGMVEWGFATYYDEGCEGHGEVGCYTDDIASCRTCYLSTEVYMKATNTTEASRPEWIMCPCCVPTTLEDLHVDEQVLEFNYTIFGISESLCTDAPTPAPTTPPPGAPPPVDPTPAPVDRTPAPVDPTPKPTPVPENTTPTDDENGTKAENIDTGDGDDGLSLGVKIGIGAGAAVAVILLGATGFGIMKARRSST